MSEHAPASTDTLDAERSAAWDQLRELLEKLSAEPWAYDFFAATRRLEVLAGKTQGAPGVGRSLRASEDPVRFAQEPSLAFAPSTISGVRRSASGAPRVFVQFMGLLGPQGPMPTHLTEYARSRERHHGDATLARFFDLFNHRMVSLFYRAWAMNRPTVSLDRSASGGEDRFAHYAGSLMGIGQGSSRGRDALPDSAKTFFVGRYAQTVRNAEGLKAMVEAYFGVPCEVTEFVGRWIELPASDLCRLGVRPETGQLGRTAVVGSWAWDCQSTFELRLGPMGLSAYERLLPGGRSHARLRAMVDQYVGLEMDGVARLVLREAEVPVTQLGRSGRVGFTTWLSRGKLGRDADDVTLRV